MYEQNVCNSNVSGVAAIVVWCSWLREHMQVYSDLCSFAISGVVRMFCDYLSAQSSARCNTDSTLAYIDSQLQLLNPRADLAIFKGGSNY